MTTTSMQTTTHRLFAALLTSLAIAGFGWAAAPVITQVSTWGETYNTDWAGYYTTSNASIYLTAADSDGDIDFSSSELWPVEHELAYQSVMDYQTFDKWGAERPLDSMSMPNAGWSARIPRTGMHKP